jgi:hypothetical protein
MNEFIEINKPKLKFAFLACLTIFSLIGLLPTFLIRDLTPIERLLLFLSIGLGFSFFILFLAIVSEYFKFATRRKAFNKQTISDFFTLNKFQTVLTRTETKWLLTQESKKGIVNGFPVLVDLHVTNSNLLRFDFLVKQTPISKEKFNELQKLLGQHDTEFNFESISVNVNHKKQSSPTELKNKLTEFADLLVKEAFVPDTNTERQNF